MKIPCGEWREGVYNEVNRSITILSCRMYIITKFSNYVYYHLPKLRKYALDFDQPKLLRN